MHVCAQKCAHTLANGLFLGLFLHVFRGVFLANCPGSARKARVSPAGPKENVFPASGTGRGLVPVLAGCMHVAGRPELCRFVVDRGYAGGACGPGVRACLAGQCYLGLWQVKVYCNYFLSPGSIIVIFSASAIR